MRLAKLGWMARFGSRLSGAIPAPMAAPETVRLRRLRLSLLALLVWISALTLLFPILRQVALMATVLVWQASALAAFGVGVIWVHGKNRADNAWLYRDETD